MIWTEAAGFSRATGEAFERLSIVSTPAISRLPVLGSVVLVACLMLAGCSASSGGSGPSVVTVGFGTGGSECSLTGVASRFVVGVPVRAVVTFSPALPTGSTVTITMAKDGSELADARETLTSVEPTPCIHATLADLEVGHYRVQYSIDPSSMPPASGEFEVTR